MHYLETALLSAMPFRTPTLLQTQYKARQGFITGLPNAPYELQPTPCCTDIKQQQQRQV
jgi:hypothetical protein